MEKIARLVHQVSWDIANADGAPESAGDALEHTRLTAVKDS